MTDFQELMDGVRAAGEGEFAAHAPESWFQGRTLYGGLSTAFCYMAAARTFEDLPPLRSVHVSFIGPAGGDVVLRARELRRGRSVSFIEADLVGEKGLATRCVFAFGAARDSAFDIDFLETPAALPRPEDCAPYIDPDAPVPGFIRNFETRLVAGGRPVSTSPDHDHWIWTRHRSTPADPVAGLLAIADVPPPAILPMFSEPAPVSSMTWMFNILPERLETEDGWWLLRSRAEHARSGYSSQNMGLWNRAGAPVVAGRQSVAIFA